MAGVAGGWCLLIVAFAVASTLTLAVRQRDREMALLRSVGATPGQVRRMIVGRGARWSRWSRRWSRSRPAFGLGRLLFGLLCGTEQVAPAVDYRFGFIATGIGVGVTVLGAVHRRAGHQPAGRPGCGARQALAADEPRRMGWKRVAVRRGC